VVRNLEKKMNTENAITTMKSEIQPFFLPSGHFDIFFACNESFFQGIEYGSGKCLKRKNCPLFVLPFSGENSSKIANYIFSFEISIIRFEENKSCSPK